MNDEIRRMIAQAEKARENLEAAIMREMEIVARRDGFDSMFFYLTTTIERDGREVESGEIDELDQAYCDHVQPNGLHALWTKEKGWN